MNNSYTKVLYNHNNDTWMNSEGDTLELLHGSIESGKRYGFFLNNSYWDCDCEDNYIHKRSESEFCNICGVHQEDMPDSREHEIKSGEHFAKV